MRDGERVSLSEVQGARQVDWIQKSCSLYDTYSRVTKYTAIFFFPYIFNGVLFSVIDFMSKKTTHLQSCDWIQKSCSLYDTYSRVTKYTAIFFFPYIFNGVLFSVIDFMSKKTTHLQSCYILNWLSVNL